MPGTKTGKSGFVHPAKWRETIDPFALPYHSFRPKEVLGYPHAGNDVFHVRGIYQGQEITAYIKVARQKGAAISNEIAMMQQLSWPAIPKIIDFGLEAPAFSVAEERPGLRLSVILGENQGMDSLNYMEEYGELLGKIHGLKVKAGFVADRRFFHPPTAQMLEELGLSSLEGFFWNPPAGKQEVFCHGDFHYANLLWENHHVSGILDFELAGYGNRDFDIAWAIFRRPGQKFLKTQEERQKFLDGYRKYGEYDGNAIRYYMAQIYVYFLPVAKEDAEYNGYVRTWLMEHCASVSQKGR